MRFAAILTSVALVLGGAFVVAARVGQTPAQQAAGDGWAPSVDVLLDEFLLALRNNDAAALNRLRVTEAEYLDVLIPAQVSADRQPVKMSETKRKYFWGVLDEKSRLFGDALLKRYGGRSLTRQSLAFTDAERRYPGYTAMGQVRMRIVEGDDPPAELPSGWIAELDGKYKFIGFEWNN